MSGSMIGGVIGATIGFFLGGPMGAVQGFAIGSAIGGVLMPGELPPVSGPRLDDLRAQSSEYGRPIPILYGTIGLAGNVIWSTDIVEVKTTTEQGGGSGPSQEVTEYSYYANFAVAICDGPIENVLRIWAGPEKRLIYDGFVLEGGTIRIYTGSDTQLPDSLIEQDKGVGNVPAYRGTAYVVFENYPLANDLNRLPFLTFEVSTGGATCGDNYTIVGSARLYDPAPELVGSHDEERVWGGAEQDPETGLIYYVSHHDDTVYFNRADPVSKEVLSQLELGPYSFHTPKMALNPTLRSAMVIRKGSAIGYLVSIDAWTSAPVDFGLDAAGSPLAKSDVIVVNDEYVYLNLQNKVQSLSPLEMHADNWGRQGAVYGGYLVACGNSVAAVSQTQPLTIDGAQIAVATGTYQFSVYDPVARRLIDFNQSAYYDFESGELVVVDTPLPYTVTNATYNPYLRRIFADSNAGMLMFNPAEFSQENGFPVECVLFAGSMIYADESPVNAGYSLQPVVLPNDRGHMAFIDNIPSGSGDIFLFTVGTAGEGMLLSDIVADLCDRAGLSSYDVSELTDTVDGYAIAKQTDVRSAIDALRSAYYFDAVESQGVARFVKRGSATVTEIDDDDLAAHNDGGEAGDPLRTTRIQEVELPRSATVSYLQAATDYATATKTAKRLTGYSENQTTLEMPLVLSDTKAQEIAEVNLHAAWAQRRLYEFNLPRKYSYLEPTDLVLVKGNLMRLMKVTATPFGVLKCQAVSDDSFYYAPHVVVTETPANDKQVYTPGETILAIM